MGSKRQPTISITLTSCEAEIVAASEASQEAVYLSSFLDELKLRDPGPVSLEIEW